MYIPYPRRSGSDFLEVRLLHAFLFFMWRWVWGKFNQEPRRPKRSLTIDTSSKSIRSPRLVKKNPNFIAFHVFFLQQSFLSSLCNLEQERPTSIYTKILLKGAPAFCWILFFCIFFYPASKPRFMMLVIWYDMCFCWFRFDCWKLKISQFQAFVQLQMWPNRSWSPSWVRWGAV